MSSQPTVLLDRELHVPPSLHDLALFDLPLRRCTADALLRSGLLWVGDLHGRSLTSLLQIRRFGPWSVTVLIDALAVVWRRSAAGPPALTGAGGESPLAARGFGGWALGARRDRLCDRRGCAGRGRGRASHLPRCPPDGA